MLTLRFPPNIEQMPPARLFIDRLLSIPTFCEFMVRNGDRLYHKLAPVKDPDFIWDLLTELEFAALISSHVAAVDMLPERAGGVRTADFSFSLMTHGTFHAEVKRIRQSELVKRARADAKEQGWFKLPYQQKESFKFSDALLRSLRQLDPERGNIVYIKVDSDIHEPEDAIDACRHVFKRLEMADDEYFKAHSFSGASEARECWNRLGIVVVRPRGKPLPGISPRRCRNQIIVNEVATHPIPRELQDIFSNADGT